MYMKKITPGIRRDLLNLHIREEDLDIILYTAIFGGYLVLRVAKTLKVHEQKKASYLRCA